MKKILVFAAAMFAAVALSAQEKGDMYISGTFNVSTGNTVEAQGTTTVKTPGVTRFGIAPEFGIFVIDGLEVNVGVGYSLEKKQNNLDAVYIDPTVKPLYDNTNMFGIRAGLNYHVKICDMFYWAPGVKFLLDFGSTRSQVSVSETSKLGSNTDFTFRVSMLKFEFRPGQHFGIAFEAGNLDYTTSTVKEPDPIDNTKEYKTRNNNFNWNLNYGAQIGFKYYF